MPVKLTQTYPYIQRVALACIKRIHGLLNFVIQRMRTMDVDRIKILIDYAIQPRIVFCACKMSLVVGTLLMLINYGDKLWLDQMTTTDWVKAGISYFVPYAVATYSAIEVSRK